MRLDYCVEKLADKGLKGIKKRTLIVLRMGIYAIDRLDSVPDYAAVNEAVALAKKVSRGTDRFINALLRRYIKDKDSITVQDDNLSLKYSYPEKLITLLKSQYGEDTEKLLAAMNEPPELILRANTLMAEPEDLVRLLSDAGIQCEKIEGSRTALVCRSGQPIETSYYRDGWFSVQSLSSIMSIEAFAPAAGSRVLDMCAAPGGKSCAMAELMGGEGEITACDIHPHRLELIKASAERLGLDNIGTALLDGTVYNEEFEDAFDFVLADVPCSGLGVIRRKPEIKYKKNDPDMESLPIKQRAILESSSQYVKMGGTLVYSTCTINKYENDRIVNDFLAKYKDFEEVERKQLLPNVDGTDGFFYCVMRRKTF